MLVGHDGLDYLPEDGRRVCRLSDRKYYGMKIHGMVVL
jgi:hypothetical protein